MPRRVDQVEVIARAIARDVDQSRRLSLDGKAPLALEVHGVQNLRFHLAVSEPAAALNEPVGKRRLAVIDVRDDREIADVLHGSHWAWVPAHSKQRGTAKCPLPSSGPRCPQLPSGGLLLAFCAGTA